MTQRRNFYTKGFLMISAAISGSKLAQREHSPSVVVFCP